MSEWIAPGSVGLILGFVLGIIVAMNAANELTQDRISAGFFAYDGKPYRIQPITNPDRLPPLPE